MGYTSTLSRTEPSTQSQTRLSVNTSADTQHDTTLDSNRTANCKAFSSVYYRDLVRLQQKHSNVIGLSCCGRRTIEGSNVTIGMTDKGISKQGIFYCRSFMCIKCSKRRVAEQTEKVASVIDELDTAFFLTLTIKQLDDWGEHKKELMKCWNSLRGRLGRWCAKRDIEQPAYFRTIDFTVSPYEAKPSLHTHLHIAIGWREDIGYNADEFRAWVRDSWVETCSKRGVYSSLKGQDIQLIKKGSSNSETVGFYLSKPVISKLGAELTSLHKSGSGVGKTSFGLGRLMIEAVDAEGVNKEHLTKVYSSVATFMKGTKFQARNHKWRAIERELEAAEIQPEEDGDNNEVIRELEIGNHNFAILVKEFGGELVNYCEETLQLGGERLGSLAKIVDAELMVELDYDFTCKEEKEQTLIELFREHLHHNRVDWGNVDRRQVSFIRSGSG